MPLRSILFGVLVCTSTLFGGQIVKLQNGLTMRVEKADRDGDQVFLTTNSGVQILAASEIKSIEEEPDPNNRPVAPVLKSKETEMKAQRIGVEVVNSPVMIDGQAKSSLTAAIAMYLEETKLTKKPKTLAAYSTALNYFAASLKVAVCTSRELPPTIT